MRGGWRITGIVSDGRLLRHARHAGHLSEWSLRRCVCGRVACDDNALALACGLHANALCECPESKPRDESAGRRVLKVLAERRQNVEVARCVTDAGRNQREWDSGISDVCIAEETRGQTHDGATGRKTEQIARVTENPFAT